MIYTLQQILFVGSKSVRMRCAERVEKIWTGEVYRGFGRENLRGIDGLEDLVIDRKIILK